MLQLNVTQSFSIDLHSLHGTQLEISRAQLVPHLLRHLLPHHHHICLMNVAVPIASHLFNDHVSDGLLQALSQVFVGQQVRLGRVVRQDALRVRFGEHRRSHVLGCHVTAGDSHLEGVLLYLLTFRRHVRWNRWTS